MNTEAKFAADDAGRSDPLVFAHDVRERRASQPQEQTNVASWPLERGIVRPDVSKENPPVDLLKREPDRVRGAALPNGLRALDSLYA